MPPNARRFWFALTAGIILAYYLFFTWRSIGLYFDPDDMMNLYLAWSKPVSEVFRANLFFWSEFYRPLGALFYRTVFGLAGFNPLPFRVICLAIGIGNIGLCCWFTWLITRSERAMALAGLIFAFHPRLLEVWYRTAVVYDLLCFTFFYLAACVYIGGKGRGRLVAVFFFFVCALNMKEMAVVLPAVLLGYELVQGQVIWKRLWPIALMGLMDVPFIIGKTSANSLLANNPFYQSKYTWDRFGHAWAVYLNYVFVRETIVPWSAMAVLAALLAVAVAFRSRQLAVAWLIIVLGTLPVSFIPYRGGFVLYLSWAGWALYGSVVLVALQDRILRGWPSLRMPLACAVFFLAGWRLGKISLHEQRTDPRRWLFDPPAQVRAFATQIYRMHPVFPQGVRMLFLEDGFSTNEWTPWFIMKLAWHDDTMVIDRVKMMDGKSPVLASYQYVFNYQDGLYKQVQP